MLKSVELTGFKSFARKGELAFGARITAVVGPNGSGKSNVAEAFRFVLGEQSMKSLRSKRGEDLIWAGSNGLPRANRASAKVVFDNESHFLDIEYGEVSIERVVHRDGQNEYFINNAPVRLKDVVRLLAGANIGGSGYHIISQGEADRILSASGKERREMVEDALGLKLFQHKKFESEKKLTETHANMDRVRSLRRELAPHLKFLQMQVEKFEKAREMKDELAHKLGDYLARERAYIVYEKTRISDDRKEALARVQMIEERMRQARAALANNAPQRNHHAEAQLEQLEREARETRRQRDELQRELGRAEGAAESVVREAAAVPAETARTFAEDVLERIDEAQHAPDPDTSRGILAHAREMVTSFLLKIAAPQPVVNVEAQQRVEMLTQHLAAAERHEQAVRAEADAVREGLRKAREQSHEAERVLLTLEADKREATAHLHSIDDATERAQQMNQRFEEEVREGIALIGAQMPDWTREDIPEGALSEPRDHQERRRRDIERLKIKIEEYGAGSGDDVMREYAQTKERDEFFERELNDLEHSAAALTELIAKLEADIDERFTQGLTKINEALLKFFTTLFGGGHAELRLEEWRPPRRRKSGDAEDDGEDVEPDSGEETETGLGIEVTLPRKKVRGLEALSGGERALTSIALIFAMSQVNPPPFLILDETDAALDEANSRRYADLIIELSKRTQLILITHNRATMSAAGILYGVTMGVDGVSKLLSVRLEEAERVAK